MPLRLLLRLHRNGLIAMSYLGVFYALVNSAVYPVLGGTTAATQRAFGAQVSVLAQQIMWLLPAPLHPETATAYLQWRGYGVFAIAFAAWALVAGCGTVRRDEDRGLVEAWLSAGLPRSRVLLTRAVAFAICAAAVVTVTGVAGAIGCAIAGFPVSVGGITGQSLALWALALACYAITLLVAQQASTYRSAAGAAGGLVLLLFLLDSLGRTSSPRPPVTSISVFALYNRNNAVAPAGSFDVASVVILLAITVAMVVLALLAFNRRDLGAGLVRRRATLRAPGRLASTNPLLRTPVLRSMWIHRISLMVWAVSAAALAAFLVSLVGATVGLITKSAQLSGLLHGLPGDVHLVLLGVIWFTFAEAIIAVLSITHVARWANEDGTGFLEMELTGPRSRWGVLGERAAELALTLTVVSFLAAAMIVIVAPQQGIVVPVGGLLTATGLLLPFGLTFAAVGALLAGWRPRLTVAVLATVAVVSYLLFELAPIFRWPSWVADLSVFQLYGTPLSTPVFVGGLVAMLVIIVAGFGAAGFALSRRDVAA